MYNVKIKDYGNGSQSRLYTHDFYGGDELKALREYAETAKYKDLQLQYDLYLKKCPSFDSFLSFEDFVQLRPFDDECRVVDNSERIIKQNLLRTKKTIYDVCRCNTWDYFITLTFKREKDSENDKYYVDCSNYDDCIKAVGKWFNNVRNRKANDIKYVIVPEFHADGEHYHFHGLLSNVGNLSFVDSGHKTKDGLTIYNIADWKFGFTNATKVKDTSKCSSYITKYITKDLEKRIKGKKHFVKSQNCDMPKIINLYMSDEEKMKYVYGLKDICYTKTDTNIYNTVTYIEHK